MDTLSCMLSRLLVCSATQHIAHVPTRHHSSQLRSASTMTAKLRDSSNTDTIESSCKTHTILHGTSSGSCACMQWQSVCATTKDVARVLL
eukprot:17331-Heterococcus_DN1.PRE.4